jgi:hypothetical protein
MGFEAGGSCDGDVSGTPARSVARVAHTKGNNTMAGMLQILTYLLAFYLIIKGVEILQIGLASNRAERAGVIAIGVLTLLACAIAAGSFVKMQDEQAASLSRSADFGR